MVYIYICFSLPDDQTKKNEGEIKVKKIQKLQGNYPSIHLCMTLLFLISDVLCMSVHIEALFSLDLQLCSVIEEKLRICRGTGRWSLATCRLLVHPHPENTPQGVTLLSDAQEEGNFIFLSIDTQSGATDLYQSLFLSQW